MPSHCISAAAPLPAPLEFSRFREQGVSLLVDPTLQSAVQNLDLQTLPIGAGHGRGPSVILELPNHHERLHLRRVLHGGWASSLWGNRVAGLRRSERELEVTRQMRTLGVPVPYPVLVWGRRRGLLWEALLGTIYEEQTSDGIDFLSSQPSPTEILDAASAAGTAIRRLHDQGCQHADLHIGNLLFRSEGSHCEAVIVDLDRARTTSPPNARRRMRELMRLYRSLVKRDLLETVGKAGCNAFLDAYIAGQVEMREALMQHWEREKLRIKIHSLLW